MIIADYREPKPLVDLLRQMVPVEIATLHTGDYLIIDRDGHTVGIERKAISDFLGSFGDRRLRQQLTRLRRAYRPILLLEGFYNVDQNMQIVLRKRQTGWYHLAVQMALFSIQNVGIRIIWTLGHETTVDVLRGLHQRAEKGCLVGLDEWGMEDDDGGGPENGPDDARLEPITSLVGAGPAQNGHRTVGAPRKPRATPRHIAVASEPPTLAIGPTALPRDRGRPA